MKKMLLAYIIGLIFVPSCKLKDDQKQAKKTGLVSNDRISSPIDLYSFDSSFVPYFPDSSLNFTDGKKLKQYWSNDYLRFAKFCKYKRSLQVNQDSMELIIQNAQIHADDLWEVINFKYCKNVKNLNSMNLLSEASPFSNIVNLQKRFALYNSFPTKIKESATGKKTYHILQNLAFNHNRGQNFHQYDKTILIDHQNNMKNLEYVLKIPSQYQIIIFGASWCRACILGERQLKRWMPLIDTELIKVISISIDTDRDKWEKYVAKEQYTWNCYLLANGGMDNEMVRGLKFEAIPVNFLLDQTGKIIAENVDIRKILKEIPIIKTK